MSNKESNINHPLSLRYMGEDILKEKAAPIEVITPRIKQLASDMLDLMYAEEGCGLAAPQIGEALRLIVVDCDYTLSKRGPKGKRPYILINPRIIERSEETTTESEGCLSFPGVSVKIERASRVVVEAQDLEGETLRYEAENSLLSRCLQHEIDHIEGTVMLDHLGPIARMKAIAQVKAALNEQES